jgi:(1->4)-alpha-D-glucan 1-alpha-D-glucosylmutase
VPYLAALGAGAVCLSPIFEARRGSRHGYDVTDPGAVRAALGGEPAFRRLAAAARAAGLAIVLDIMPNHAAASSENPWWADVVRHGPASRFAAFLEID